MRKQSKNKSMFSKKCKCQKAHLIKKAKASNQAHDYYNNQNISSSSIESNASSNFDRKECKNDFNLSDSLSKAFFNFFPEGVAFVDSQMSLLYANDSLYKFFQSDQYDLLEKLYQLQNDLQVNELQMQKSEKAQNFILNNIVRTDQHIQTPTNKYSLKMKSYSNIMNQEMPKVYRKFSAIPFKNNSTQSNIQAPNSQSPPLCGQSPPQYTFNPQRPINSLMNQQIQQSSINSKIPMTNQNINCQTPNNHDGSQYISQFANYILQSNNNTPNMRQKSNTTLPFNNIHRNISNNTNIISSSNFHNSSIFQVGSKKNIQEDTPQNQTPLNYTQFSKSEECMFTAHYPVQDGMNRNNIQKKQAISNNLRQEIELIIQQANTYLQQNIIDTDCILDKSFTFTSRIIQCDSQKQESLAHQGFFSNNHITQNLPQVPMYREQKVSISEKLMKEESLKQKQFNKEPSLKLQTQSSQFTPLIQPSLSKNTLPQRNSSFNTQNQSINSPNLNQNFLLLASQNKEKLSDQRLNHHLSSTNQDDYNQTNVPEYFPSASFKKFQKEKRSYPKISSNSSDRSETNGVVTFEQTELKAIISCQEGEDQLNKSSPSKQIQRLQSDETIDLINLEEDQTLTEDGDNINYNMGQIQINGSPSSIYQQNQKTQQSNNERMGSFTAFPNLTQKSNCSINIQQQINQSNNNLNQNHLLQANVQQNNFSKKSTLNVGQQHLSPRNQQQYIQQTANSVTINPNQFSQSEFVLQDQSKLSSSPNWINNSNNNNTSLTVNNNSVSQKNGGTIQQHINSKFESIAPAVPFMTESYLVNKQDLLQYTNQNPQRKPKYSFSNEVLNFNEQGQSNTKSDQNQQKLQHQQTYPKKSILQPNRKNSNFRIMDSTTDRVAGDKNEIEWSEEEINRNTREVDITIFIYILNQQPVILLLIRDVTHRSYIKLLQDVSKKKSKMVSFVSHELRTPLNSIIAMLESMKNKPDIDYIETALMNSKYLLCISNDLLDLAQIKVNKFQIRKKTFNLKELIMESLEMFQIQAERQHIDLIVDYPQEMRSFITSDKNRIRQVLINLIGNAFKFTLTGSITIKVEFINNALFQVQVTDTGIGIKEGDLNKLFKTFGKLDGEESVKLNEQGVGLGLVISNMIAFSLSEEKEGLTVQSEYNKGTCFKFKILDWNIDQSEQSEDQLLAQIIEDEEDQKMSKVAEEDEERHVIKNIEQYNSFIIGKNKFFDDEKGKKFKLDLRNSSTMQSPNLSSPQRSKKEKTSNKIQSPLKQSNTFEFKSPGAERNPIRLLTNFQQIWQENRMNKLQLLKASGPIDITNMTESQQRNKIQNNPRNKLTKIATQINIKDEWGQILIVDDNMSNILAMKCLINSISPDLICNYAIRGQGAEDLVKNRFYQQQDLGYSIIFMDIVMPEQDGITTCKKIKGFLIENDINKTKIIACSGYDDEQEKRKCLQAGMIDYLVKPVFKDKLASVINQYFKLQQHQ